MFYSFPCTNRIRNLKRKSIKFWKVSRFWTTLSQFNTISFTMVHHYYAYIRPLFRPKEKQKIFCLPYFEIIHRVTKQANFAEKGLNLVLTWANLMTFQSLTYLFLYRLGGLPVSTFCCCRFTFLTPRGGRSTDTYSKKRRVLNICLEIGIKKKSIGFVYKCPFKNFPLSQYWI